MASGGPGKHNEVRSKSTPLLFPKRTGSCRSRTWFVADITVIAESNAKMLEVVGTAYNSYWDTQTCLICVYILTLGFS